MKTLRGITLADYQHDDDRGAFLSLKKIKAFDKAVDWVIENTVEKVTDVLGYVDMERGTAQPTQSGVVLKLRKGSKLGQIIFDAWFKRDNSKIDAMKILQKFEFADGATENTCLARLEEDVMIAINNFTGEAGGYLSFEVDIHYANKTTTGTMPKVDGETITFTPDSAA